jgi:hypothetical protein
MIYPVYCVSSSVTFLFKGSFDCAKTLLNWNIGYLSGAKYLIDHTDVGSQMLPGEFSRILNWVEYHTVMGQFSLQHWDIIEEPTVYKNSLDAVSQDVPVEQESCPRQKVRRKPMNASYLHRYLSNIIQIKSVSYCSHEILQLLYFMFETILKPTNPLYHSREYENSLQHLENRINNIDPTAQTDFSDIMSGLDKIWVATLELYKLAALIYLKRASRNFSGASVQIDTLIERAFVILADLETFNLVFPLLIVGCEARVDDQRMRILELIENTLKTSSLRSLRGLRSILQHIWVQDDLAVDHELDYLKKLNVVMTSYHIMPTFA